jgi:hypothetical protein
MLSLVMTTPPYYFGSNIFGLCRESCGLIQYEAIGTNLTYNLQEHKRMGTENIRRAST